MSPRKSSTSSGKPSERLRYLGLEATGASSALSTRWWAETLQPRLDRVVGRPVPLRVIKAVGRRAVVEVTHTIAPAARIAWNDAAAGGLITRKTWGTLLKAKRWVKTDVSLGRPD